MTPDDARALIAKAKLSYARTGRVGTADALDIADGYAEALAEIERLRPVLEAAERYTDNGPVCAGICPAIRDYRKAKP